MRKLLLTTIYLLCFLSIKAQEYRPFPTENAYWVHYTQELYPPFPVKYFHYGINGDTIINAQMYHKIWHSDGSYRCALREDVANKKVYIINSGSSEEKLLYDFDLKIGDHASHFIDPTYVGESVIVFIDSILLGDNLYHKRFRIDGAKQRPSGFHIVEGIGALETGLFWEFLYNPELELAGCLNCVCINGTTIYPLGGTCTPISELEHCPFPTENAVWRSSAYNHNELIDYQYTITGDTIINDLTYHKLQKNSFNRFTNESSNEHEGAFRENVTDKKVYFYSYSNHSEQLLYDFDLKTGDDVSHFITDGEGFKPTVTKTDSIMLRDGLYHKRFHITGCYEQKKYLIAGVGDCNGLFSLKFNCSGYNEELLHCVTINDQQLYNIQDCYPQYAIKDYPCDNVLSGLDEKDVKSKLTIYPNPVKDFFILNMPDYNHAKGEIEILNLLGHCVQKQSLMYDQQKIDIKHLPAGIYFVRVAGENGTITQKLIKFVAD